YLTEAGERTGQLLVSRCRRPTARHLIRRNHVGNGSTPVVRQACFELAGPFDENLAAGSEDAEMWVRLTSLTPYGCELIPRVLTGYRMRASSSSMTFERFLQGHRTSLERFKTYVPGFSVRQARRSHAEFLRIVSRKAASGGDLELSRAYLVKALREWPCLPLC